MADGYPLSGAAIRGVVLLTDGVRTAGRVRLSELVELRTAEGQAVPHFTGAENEAKARLHGVKLAFPTQHPIHIFSIAYSKDADLELLRIFPRRPIARSIRLPSRISRTYSTCSVSISRRQKGEKVRLLLALVLDKEVVKYVALPYALPFLTLALYWLTGVSKFGVVWPWLFLPALLLHGLLVANIASNRSRIAAVQGRVHLARIRLNPGYQAYLKDIRQIQASVLEKIQKSPSTALRADLSEMADELGRLIHALQELLIKHQLLEEELKRYEHARYRPDETPLSELRELYQKQRHVIIRIAREIATMDANITLIIHQYDAGGREDISQEIQGMNRSLVTWQQSIQQVYGS